MTPFQWDPSYSVGIAEIDDQHKKMVGILSRLYESVRQGNAQEMLKPIFVEFLFYTQDHFATEERLMLQYKYPDYKAHKAVHDACLRKVLTFKRALDNGLAVDPVEACEFLKAWLEDHLAGDDQEYVEFFHARGVK